MTFSEARGPSPSPIIELYQLDLNAVQHGVTQSYWFHGGTNIKDNGEVVWNGQPYQRLPIEADGFEYSGTGQLPRPRIRASNLMGGLSGLIQIFPSGLEGAKLTRIRTFARFLDAVNFANNVNPYGTPSPTTELPREIYYLDRLVVENREFVEYEMAAAFDLAGVRLPKRLVMDNLCPWVYKGTECGYTGGLATCEKTLEACKDHFGENADLPFGGFPGVGGFV